MNKKNTIVVIGNGPSMKKEYFDIIKNKGIDSIGMNSVYRYLKYINWWPTYYLGFDSKVTSSHKSEFIKLINDNNNGIKEFIFYEENFPELKNNSRVTLKTSPPKFKNQHFSHVTTGSCAVRFAIEKGYKNIILIGIDCNYKEKVAERELQKGTWGTFKLLEDPKDNPNYFFDDYQQKGDIYNIPNAPYHKASWIELATQKAKNKLKVEIYQANPNFKVSGFKNVEFEKIIDEIDE